jgi:predicted DNA-binding transcriptional regulator AlpA
MMKATNLENWNTDRLLREREAAEFLCLNPNTLRQWRYKRFGPKFHKLGSTVVYRLSDLDSFIGESAAENEPDPRA